MIHARAGAARNINIVMEEDFNNMKNITQKILLALVIISCMRVNAFAIDYDLSRMRTMNPDFTTYPADQGIIWLKHTAISSAKNGGIEAARLYVIRGRQGLESKWLNWNIPVPANGNVEILESSIYDPASGAKIGSAKPEDNTSYYAVNFSGLPEDYIIVLTWKEIYPEKLEIEGLCWFQEDLRVWESILEINSASKLTYRTFPERISPEHEEIDDNHIYIWRRINIDPYTNEGEIARLSRMGAAFSVKKGNSGLAPMLRNVEEVDSIPVPIKKFTPKSLIAYLMKQPEINLAESLFPRKIPDSGEWTRAEKIKLARYWLSGQKINASLAWLIPFEPDDNTPLCESIFYDPVLHVQGVKDFEFHNLDDPRLLTGAKIYTVSKENKLNPRRLPSSSYTENKLTAVMNLKLDNDARLSGTIRVILKGGWSALLLGDNPTDGTARGALLSLFPGLTNYNNVKLQKVKGTPVIVFNLVNKTGISGGGVRWLAMPPVFEPQTVKNLAGKDSPIELLFPFMIEQEINIEFPKNGKQALTTGKTLRNQDKINYSDESRSRLHSFEASAKFVVNLQTITAGNLALLQRCIDQWNAFSTRNIPIK